MSVKLYGPLFVHLQFGRGNTADIEDRYLRLLKQNPGPYILYKAYCGKAKKYITQMITLRKFNAPLMTMRN